MVEETWNTSIMMDSSTIHECSSMVDSQTGDVTPQVIKFNMNELDAQSQRVR